MRHLPQEGLQSVQVVRAPDIPQGFNEAFRNCREVIVTQKIADHTMQHIQNCPLERLVLMNGSPIDATYTQHLVTMYPALTYFGLRTDANHEHEIAARQFTRQDGQPVYVQIGPNPRFEDMCQFAGVEVGVLKTP